MITSPCPACHKTFAVDRDSVGKVIRCPACGQALTAPADDLSTRPAFPPPVPTVDAHALNRGDEADLTGILAAPLAEGELGRLGKYRILEVAGRGGMGVVFRAEDPHLKRMVAIKAMKPAVGAGAGQRFLREAQAMAAVKHDHVITIYQVDEERGVPFLAMEFLEGESLEERLKRLGKLPVPDVLSWAPRKSATRSGPFQGLQTAGADRSRRHTGDGRRSAPHRRQQGVGGSVAGGHASE